MLKRSWLGALAVVAMTVVGAATSEAQDIVLYSSDVTTARGNWYAAQSGSGAGGQRMTSDDKGWSTADAPLANPSDYFEATFTAPSYTTYHVWLRLRAGSDSKWNDSVWVQFSDSADTNGSAAYRIGTDSALMVNLEPCKDCGVSGWGWADKGYWTAQSPLVMFGARGTHTIRVQTREDGVQVDQIVLSPANYLTQAPGQDKNDVKTLSHSKDGGSGAASGSASAASSSSSSSTLAPYGGNARAVPGTIEAEDFDEGRDGIAYHDTTSENSGGALRNTGVDIQSSAGGGYNVGWTNPSEYLNYTVNVGSAGSYTAQLRVAAERGGSLHIGFNAASNVWVSVPVSSTGGWQNWTTINVPVNLGAGRQVMTLMIDSGSINLDKVTVVAGSSAPSAPSAPAAPPASGGSSYSTSGKFRMMTWNIQHGTTANGSYDPAAQARFIASQQPDVVALQEVETWDENQPQRYKQLLEQYTGNAWTVVWAPVIDSAGTEGNIILTRLPVKSQSTFQMHATSNHSEMYANRSAAQATVRVGNVDVNVFSTHLDYYNTTHRSIQEQQLMSWAQNFGGPRLIGGDFNSWWGEYWITNMMTQYTDTWQDYTGSNQNGYTVNNAVRFDYIFRSKDNGWRATPTSAWVPVTSLSDHNPVVADYRVQ